VFARTGCRLRAALLSLPLIALGGRFHCSRRRRRLRVRIDRDDGRDAAEVSGGIGGGALFEHRPRRRHGHPHCHDDPRMPLGRIDRGKLALGAVAHLGTRPEHGGVSCCAQSSAFDAGRRDRRQRQPRPAVAAGGTVPIRTPSRRSHHRRPRGNPRGRRINREPLFMDHCDRRQLDLVRNPGHRQRRRNGACDHRAQSRQ